MNGKNAGFATYSPVDGIAIPTIGQLNWLAIIGGVATLRLISSLP
jgi:hypothetical protein